jgi:pilus assembly protein Flp/PilA
VGLAVIFLANGETSMTQWLAVAQRFARDEEGASLAEYGLLLGLIAVVCIAGMTLLGTSINSMFSSLASSI